MILYYPSGLTVLHFSFGLWSTFCLILVKKCKSISTFKFLHVDIQMFQCHAFKRVLFFHGNTVAPFSVVHACIILFLDFLLFCLVNLFVYSFANMRLLILELFGKKLKIQWSELGNSVQVFHVDDGNPTPWTITLLLPCSCINRKLESEVELGLEPRHFHMTCECLKHCDKWLPQNLNNITFFVSMIMDYLSTYLVVL